MDFIDISKIAEIICGFPFQSEYFNTNGDGTRLVRGMNVTKRNLRWGEDSRWWNDFSVDLSKYQLQENDIVIGMDGSLVGKNYAKISKEDLPLLLVQRVACIRAKSNADQKFLWHCIANSRFEKYIESVKTGTTIPHISQKQISQFQVPNLPLPTQQKIAQILSSLDDKIELNNKINANLEQQAQALFKSWFVDFEPFGGEMPAEWKEKPLYEYADFINGTSFKEDEYGTVGVPIIKIAELKNGITDATQYFNGTKDSKYDVKDGDILFSWSGNPETSIDIFIWTLGNAILNQHTFNVKSNTNRKWFTYCLLKYFKPEFCHRAGCKQTTGLGHVTANDLKQIMFSSDEKSEIDFEKLITPIMEQVYNNKKENQKLASIRDTLLPKLMNGEIEV